MTGTFCWLDVAVSEDSYDRAALGAASGNAHHQATVGSVHRDTLLRTILNLQMQQAAYRASLAATSRVMQQSLMDYLR